MAIRSTGSPFVLESATIGGGTICIPHLVDDISPVDYGASTRTVMNLDHVGESVVTFGRNSPAFQGFLRVAQNVTGSNTGGAEQGLVFPRDAVLTWLFPRQANASPTSPVVDVYVQNSVVVSPPFGGITHLNEGVGAGDLLAMRIVTANADYPVVTAGIRWINGGL